MIPRQPRLRRGAPGRSTAGIGEDVAASLGYQPRRVGNEVVALRQERSAIACVVRRDASSTDRYLCGAAAAGGIPAGRWSGGVIGAICGVANSP